MRRLDAYLKFKAPSADMETRGTYAARGVNQRDEYRINSVIASSKKYDRNATPGLQAEWRQALHPGVHSIVIQHTTAGTFIQR